MSQDFGEDIFKVKPDFMTISLLSSEIRVLVIGGGKAGFIKAKSFASRGCSVTVVSLNFIKEFRNLVKEFGVKLFRVPYASDHIDSHHIVVIAIGQGKLIEEIRKHCHGKCKLFLDCSDYGSGHLVIPSQGSTKNISYSINTRAASPITSQFFKDRINLYLRDYDDLVDYISSLRKSLKGNDRLKEIMYFTASEDFNFFFKKGYADTVIKLFFP